jgi:hypothetical protein
MNLFRSACQSVAVGAVGLAAVIGLGGAAYAATPTPSTAAVTTPKAARSLLNRADKATVELKVKGAWVTYDVDRGKVTAVSPTSITLALADGTSVTDTISATTKFDGVSSAAGVTVGRIARVISTTTGAAVRVTQKAAATS